MENKEYTVHRRRISELHKNGRNKCEHNGAQVSKCIWCVSCVVHWHWAGHPDRHIGISMERTTNIGLTKGNHTHTLTHRCSIDFANPMTN